jgi:hypothetical protein
MGSLIKTPIIEYFLLFSNDTIRNFFILFIQIINVMLFSALINTTIRLSFDKKTYKKTIIPKCRSVEKCSTAEKSIDKSFDILIKIF